MRQRLNLFAVVLTAAVIAYYSIRPVPVTRYAGMSNLTLLYHAAAYFVLAAALLLYFHDTTKGHVEAVLVAALFGAGLEVVQSFLLFRFFSVTDIGVNLLGASVVLLDHHLNAVTEVVAFEDRIIERLIL